MKKLTSILLGGCVLLSAAQADAAAVNYGYSADEPAVLIASAYSVVNYAAIRIPAEIAAKYQGASITGVQINCHTFTYNGNLVNTLDAFVAEDLDNFNPSVTSTAEVNDLEWNSVTFAEPYVITGDRDVYVGYSMMTGNSADTLPFTFDDGTGVSYGDIIGYKTTKGVMRWEHAGDAGYGNLLVRAVIEGDNLPEEGLLLMSASVPEIMRTGDAFSVSGSILNYGAKALDSYDIECRFDGEKVGSVKIEDKTATGSVGDFTVDGIVLASEKTAGFEVVPVVAGKEFEPMAFTVESTLEMKPRTVLVQEFTTAECGNCPAMHRVLQSVGEKRDDFITVAHHAGFGTDEFTTVYDNAYTWFYQTGSWAPAVMFDRTNFAAYGAVANSGATPGPVMFVVNEADFVKFLDLAVSNYAWLDVNIDYTYDADTRKLDVEVSGTPSRVLDSWTKPVVNIFLVERSATGRQSGGQAGKKYVHRHIFRDALTDTYGKPVTLEAGKPYSCKVSAEIKEGLDAGDIDIVAFVANDSENANQCQVFNAASVAIDTPSTAGLDTVDAAGVEVKAVAGGVSVSGAFDCAEIYSVNGMKVAALDAPATVSLARGVYIVKVTAASSSVTEKVSVK